MRKIEKGEKEQLNFSQEARGRIIAGLGWDAREDKVGLMGRITKTDSQHDLDISAYIFNKEGEFIDFVGAEAQDSIDKSGKIYHSGDDMSGEGDGDDEFISVELNDIPGKIHSVVFLVEIRSNHVFADIEAPETRIADGMTNKNLLEIQINHDEAAQKNAFVMCSIFRHMSSDTGWMLYNISEYPNVDEIEDWAKYLSQFTG